MFLVVLFFAHGTAAAQGGPDGAAVFAKACASCHAQPAADSRAPSLDVLGQLAPETIITVLTVGNMFQQGAELTDAERRAVATFLTGRPPGTAPPPSAIGRCTTSPPPFAADDLPSGWNGWGADLANTRYQPVTRGGLTAESLSRLRLKWAFGFAGVNSARAQPAVVSGRVFVASENGDVVALDARTGCTYWTYHAQAGIRTAIALAPYRAEGGATRFALYFADGSAIAYAVDATSGREIWSRKLDDHPYARVTGAPAVYDGTVYVPTAGVGEEGQGGRPQYECCTFRGSLSAVDASTGRLVWKTYTIAESPAPRGRNTAGVQRWGPSGGAIWAAPTIDPARRAVYVATGNNYSGPPAATTDAVIAMDLGDGRIRWTFQPTPNDVFVGGCKPENAADSNCPEKLGPDLDFSMSPVLTQTTSGRDLLIVQQKSGMAYALDPEDGSLVWRYRTGPGSGLGGQWGAAVDGAHAYFGVNGTLSMNPGGMRAVRIDTGEEVWSMPPPEPLCGTVRGCSTAQGAAVTAIPGAVLSGSMDGGVRAYAAADGRLLWQFDTNREFETVNGVRANGGAID
ncbi:MAG TPA: PQQ-binding-like beta-propeller repeat protein, partial [Vicinamibacterales bacterium]|nr:PQQ-binding-like beta-propeller repeat protein [Vicinamibacterales bacterium]